MEAARIAGVAFGALLLTGAAYLFWRIVWFYRNPRRTAPGGDGLVSAADGTVVYVRKIAAATDVIHVKRELEARLEDIIREDVALPKLLIGVFMSPFDVHYNRAPFDGMIDFVRHHPGQGRNAHMGPMHWRVLTRRPPYQVGSAHLVRNERTVTKLDGTLRGRSTSCYIVQIAARTVAGIDSYVKSGDLVAKGDVFGMIRIGSQVDLVIPWRDDLTVLVRPGDRVRAGETVVVC